MFSPYRQNREIIITDAVCIQIIFITAAQHNAKVTIGQPIAAVGGRNSFICHFPNVFDLYAIHHAEANLLASVCVCMYVCCSFSCFQKGFSIF